MHFIRSIIEFDTVFKKSFNLVWSKLSNLFIILHFFNMMKITLFSLALAAPVFGQEVFDWRFHQNGKSDLRPGSIVEAKFYRAKIRSNCEMRGKILFK